MSATHAYWLFIQTRTRHMPSSAGLQSWSSVLLTRNAAKQLWHRSDANNQKGSAHLRPYLHSYESYGLSRNTTRKHHIRHASSASLQLRHGTQAHLRAVASALHTTPPLRPVQAARHVPSSQAWTCSTTATTLWFNQPRACNEIALHTRLHSDAALVCRRTSAAYKVASYDQDISMWCAKHDLVCAVQIGIVQRWTADNVAAGSQRNPP